MMNMKVGPKNLRIFRVDETNLPTAMKLWTECVQEPARQRVSDLHGKQSKPSNYLASARKKAHWMWVVEVFSPFLLKFALLLTHVFLGPTK